MTEQKINSNRFSISDMVPNNPHSGSLCMFMCFRDWIPLQF